MRRFSIVLLFFATGFTPAAATDRPSLGYVSKAEARLNIFDQKSIWSASRRKVTVYLLGCSYDAALLEGWTQRQPFLTCRRVTDQPSELSVKLVFHFSETHQLTELELHASPEPYRPELRHVWASDFPVVNLVVGEDDELHFDADIDLPSAQLRAFIHGV